jgi:hypothetical protein
VPAMPPNWIIKWTLAVIAVAFVWAVVEAVLH